MDVSVCIPYFRRLPQLRLTLQHLARQRLDGASMEVILGTAIHEDPAPITSLAAETGLPLSTAPVKAPWSTAKARNAAMRHARGSVLLLLDCDIQLPEDVVAGHLRYHTGFGAASKKILLGPVNDYDKLEGADPDHASADSARDRRLALSIPDSPFPWCVCWTGQLSLRRDDLIEANEWFDEEFIGWGAEDEEFSFRLYQKGFRVDFDAALCGYHVPHERNAAKNMSEERANMARFLRKHTCFEVELVVTFRDIEAMSLYPNLRAALDALARERNGNGRVPHGSPHLNGARTVCFGGARCPLPPGSAVLNPIAGQCSESHRLGVESFRILGLTTPFADKSYDVACLNASYQKLGEPYWSLLMKEAGRIASRTEIGL